MRGAVGDKGIRIRLRTRVDPQYCSIDEQGLIALKSPVSMCLDCFFPLKPHTCVSLARFCFIHPSIQAKECVPMPM